MTLRKLLSIDKKTDQILTFNRTKAELKYISLIRSRLSVGPLIVP